MTGLNVVVMIVAALDVGKVRPVNAVAATALADPIMIGASVALQVHPRVATNVATGPDAKDPVEDAARMIVVNNANVANHRCHCHRIYS